MNTIGNFTCKLKSKIGNPRNSEGAFIELDCGRLMYAYSQYNGISGNDEDDCNIAAIFSDDDGESWNEPRILKRAEEFGVRNLMSVSLIRMQNNDIGMFYIVKKLDGSNEIALSRSNDNGESFYRTVLCLRNIHKGYYVLNNDRMERLSDGRLVMPVAFHRLTLDTAVNRIVKFDGFAESLFFVSSDDGENFDEASGRMTLGNTAYSSSGVQEPGVIELKSGVIWAYARTDRGSQYESYSVDSLHSFTPAQPSRFTSPCSPMKIKRSPADGVLYSVWNPIPNYNGRPHPDRNPISIAKSSDDGRSWTNPLHLEALSDHSYCYPAIHFTNDNSVLVAYLCYASNLSLGCDLHIKKISLDIIK